MSLADYEEQALSCFSCGYAATWRGGTAGKVGDDPEKLYIAIKEDENWALNKCVLQDWFFDEEAFKGLPLEIDCEQYGVYVIWMKTESAK